MRIKLRLPALIFLTYFLAGCEDKTIIQSNDEIYSYTIGGVELIFNFNSIFGKQLTMNNSNDRSVGVYIVDNNTQSQIIFSDSWTWGGNSEVVDDVNFNHDQELQVTVIIYNDLATALYLFIEALGPDFLEEIQDIWIYTQYEEIIVLE